MRYKSGADVYRQNGRAVRHRVLRKLGGFWSELEVSYMSIHT